MPQKRTKQGRFIDAAHPLSADGRRNINETLLTAYKNGIMKQEFEVAPPKTIAAQNSVTYPPAYGNTLLYLKYRCNLGRQDFFRNDNDSMPTCGKSIQIGQVCSNFRELYTRPPPHF